MKLAELRKLHQYLMTQPHSRVDLEAMMNQVPALLAVAEAAELLCTRNQAKGIDQIRVAYANLISKAG